jgi:hypothetical protein
VAQVKGCLVAYSKRLQRSKRVLRNGDRLRATTECLCCSTVGTMGFLKRLGDTTNDVPYWLTVAMKKGFTML